MFADLEAEIVRILTANLSPGLVSTGRVIAGPVAQPTPANIPTVSFAVRGFEVVPADDQASPPREVKNPVTDTFPAAAGTTLTLSQIPLEPLRSVVVTPTIGSPRILRERDDYAADYVNGIVHLRLPPDGGIQVAYFTRRTLHIVGATRLRASGQLTIWADPAANTGNLTQIALAAVGALLSNVANLNGFLSRTQDIGDSGLAALGVRSAFLIFETASLAIGQEVAANQWTVGLVLPAWIVLVPRDETSGVIRRIATTVSWNASQAANVIAASPTLLARSVTDVAGVDAALAATLLARGIATIADLAAARPVGPAAANLAILSARSIRGLADRVVTGVVMAQPRIDDLAAFLAQDLASVNLAALDIAPDAIAAITADAGSLAATCSVQITFGDLFDPSS